MGAMSVDTIPVNADPEKGQSEVLATMHVKLCRGQVALTVRVRKTQ